MFVEIFDTRRSPVGCNFISGRSESAHEESAGDEGRTVPSSGAALFLRFALNLWRYPEPPCEDNIRLRSTDCDFNAWRHCQKGNKLASIANLHLRHRFLRLPICSSKTSVSSTLYQKRIIRFLSSSCSEIPMSSFDFQCPWPAKQKDPWLP